MAVPQEQFFEAEVLEVAGLNPVMTRVVLGGAGLAGYPTTGLTDEWFRLMIPEPGTSGQLPEIRGDTYAFADPQPQPRWYTVRRWDGDRTELTVDLVVHAHGAATEWVRQVRTGDRIVVGQPQGRYEPPADVDWQLIIADQTGLPAASRIIENLPAGRTAIAVLEGPNVDAEPVLQTTGELTQHWVVHPEPALEVSPLAAATRSLTLPPGRGYVWMAGESASCRDVRKYFRHELGWRSEAYDIVGYWRPESANYRRRIGGV